MKILVLSDSHGNCDNMRRAIELEQPDHVFHLGDHSDDVRILRREYPMLPIASVRGNCDWTDKTTPDSVQAVLDGVSIWAVHGHLYGVKGGLLRFSYAAKEKAVRVALFGHTHCPYCEEHDGIWFLNPGSCAYGIVVNYGIIETSCGEVRCLSRSFNERSEDL